MKIDLSPLKKEGFKETNHGYEKKLPKGGKLTAVVSGSQIEVQIIATDGMVLDADMVRTVEGAIKWFGKYKTGYDPIMESASSLSFSEKRGLQKTVATNLTALAAGGVSFSEKRRMQKEISEALVKLGTTGQNKPDYATWERAVTDAIINKLEVSNSDAQGIVEAQEFTMKQAWGVALDPDATADKVIAASTPPATMADVDKAIPRLKAFIGNSQLQAILDGMKGEEGQFFRDKIIEIAKITDGMPMTYDTDGMGDKAPVSLHYFKGSSDWYIIEKDTSGPGEDQTRAFGYTILNGDKENAELGYISIAELIKFGVELDMYWEKQSLGRIKGVKNANPDNTGAPTVADVGKRLETMGWINGVGVWTVSNAEAQGFTGTGRYMVSGTDAGGGNSGWILVDYWDKNAFVPLGGSFSLTGNTVDDIVHGINTMISDHEKQNSGNQSQALTDLVSGKYNDATPELFLGVVQKAIAEIGDVAPVIPPCVSYIEANQDKVSAVMESAFAEIFGDLWSKAHGTEQAIFESAGRKSRGAPLFGGLLSPPSRPATNPVRVIIPGTDDIGPPRKIIIEIDENFNEPSSFRGIIQAIESGRAGDEITHNINSNGGDTQSAQAIYVALQKTEARTKAVIINAYSSGSIVAMACDEIETTPFCSMMIHNASSGAGGKLGDMAGYATFKNDYFAEWYGQLYAGFLTDEELKDVAKGQDIWLKESQITARLKNWTPIKQRK